MDARQTLNCILALTTAAFFVVVPTSAYQNAAKQTKAAPKAGDVKVNPIDQQRYVWIPPGTFDSGCSYKDQECPRTSFPPARSP